MHKTLVNFNYKKCLNTMLFIFMILWDKEKTDTDDTFVKDLALN